MSDDLAAKTPDSLLTALGGHLLRLATPEVAWSLDRGRILADWGMSYGPPVSEAERHR